MAALISATCSGRRPAASTPAFVSSGRLASSTTMRAGAAAVAAEVPAESGAGTAGGEGCELIATCLPFSGETRTADAAVKPADAEDDPAVAEREEDCAVEEPTALLGAEPPPGRPVELPSASANSSS